MNAKNFIVGGIVGGIVDFLLGWLFWGILFADFFPATDESKMNMLFIFLGCMTFGFFISYIFSKWAHIATAVTGASAGAVIALFMSLFHNFFYYGNNLTPDYKVLIMDVALTVVCGAIVGSIIGFVNGKMK
ncbi:MAG: hypothetical protein O9267_04045 [Flavobacterium sp.]|uniref:hypothetical protein n=1 Tax=Flavobacterium sp. TaxID=239 RepID=UPI0022CAA74A|nr:hypothetical protein [Flavobacterium sp.]MCZ8196756.1 hypothetical protein [Flavobacterium sp.]